MTKYLYFFNIFFPTFFWKEMWEKDLRSKHQHPDEGGGRTVLLQTGLLVRGQTLQLEREWDSPLVGKNVPFPPLKVLGSKSMSALCRSAH